MMMDKLTTFAKAVALNTGAAGTYNVGDIIDLRTIGRDIAQGHTPIFLHFSVDTTATSGGSATGKFQVVSDSTTSIATDGTASFHGGSVAIPVASLTAGLFFSIPLIPVYQTFERYLAFQQVTGTAAFTAGKVNAWLGFEPWGWKAYADAVN